MKQSYFAGVMLLFVYTCLADYSWDGLSWDCQSHGESSCESSPLSEFIRSKSTRIVGSQDRGDSAFEPTKSMAKTGRKLLGGCSGTGCASVNAGEWWTQPYTKVKFIYPALQAVMPDWNKKVYKEQEEKPATATCVSGCSIINTRHVCDYHLDTGIPTTCILNYAFTADTTCTFQVAATYSLETQGSSYKYDFSSVTSTWDDATPDSCKEWVSA